MVPNVEKVIDSVQLGEGPHWDEETQSLYFVDIRGQYVHKYTPSTKKHTRAFIGRNISIIIPVQGKRDQFVISMDNELVLIQWDGESEEVSILEKLCEDSANNHFNDGKCDPTGRLWIGTNSKNIMETPESTAGLFSYEKKTLTTQLTKIGISNGLAFNDDLKKFYYIDTLKGTLDEYDYDITTGKISNGKPIFTLNPMGGLSSKRGLDGMTIDTEGNLWVAVFNEFKIIKIDPRKPEIVVETIKLPMKQITSVTFGGPNLDELYVTSGRIAMFGEAPSSLNDGATFRITGLGAKGLPGVRVVL